MTKPLQISRKELLKAIVAFGGGITLSVVETSCESSTTSSGELTLDGGNPDGGSPPDSGSPDSGQPDSGRPDSGMPDSGTPDSGTPDSGLLGDGGTGYCQDGAINGTITANHGHSLMVPAPDIQEGTERTYSIQGTSGHPHFVTLTPEHFALLAQNQTFVITSTLNASHTHDVTVMCAP